MLAQDNISSKGAYNAKPPSTRTNVEYCPPFRMTLISDGLTPAKHDFADWHEEHQSKHAPVTLLNLPSTL